MLFNLGAWEIFKFPHPDHPWIGGYCDPRMVPLTNPPMQCEGHLDCLYGILDEKLRMFIIYGPREPTEENYHKHRGDYEEWKMWVETQEAEAKK